MEAQSIKMCQMSGNVDTLLETLDDMQVYQSNLSNGQKFKATLRPITYDKSKVIETKIELTRDCETWDDVEDVVMAQTSTTEGVVFLGVSTVEEVQGISEILSQKPAGLPIRPVILLEPGHSDEVVEAANSITEHTPFLVNNERGHQTVMDMFEAILA